MTQLLRVRWHPMPDARTPSPYIHQLGEALTARGVDLLPLRPVLDPRPHQIVHVHWPENLRRTGGGRLRHVASISYAGTVRAQLRRPGISVVYTAHNPEPHEGFVGRADAAAYESFLRTVDTVIVHQANDRSVLTARWPILRQTRFVTIEHGPISLGPPRGPAPQGRIKIVALGRIAPYKMLDQTIANWPSDAADLHVAGEPLDDALGAHLEHSGAVDRAVSVELGRVTDSSFHDSLVGAHAALALQRNGLTSGAAVAALTHAVPVVMSPGAQADALRARLGPQWVHVLDRPDRDGLDAAVRWAATAGTGPRPQLGATWDEIAQRTIEVYRSLEPD